MALFGILFLLMPLIIPVLLVWWLVTTLNSINRNTHDIAMELRRMGDERRGERAYNGP
jgi:hypothetical protein